MADRRDHDPFAPSDETSTPARKGAPAKKTVKKRTAKKRAAKKTTTAKATKAATAATAATTKPEAMVPDTTTGAAE